MSNPLFDKFGGYNNNIANFMQRFQQFKQNFKGDPRQQIQQMLNSGQVSQQQYNQAIQIAQQFQKLLNNR